MAASRELQCKVQCLCLIAADAVRTLIDYLSSNSDIPGGTFSFVLQNFEEIVRKLNSIRYNDNRLKLFKNNTIRSAIIIKELDLMFLLDALLNVPAFPFCSTPYVPRGKPNHSTTSCNNNVVCCAVCLKCTTCMPNTCTFRELKGHLEDLKLLSNVWAHGASKDVVQLEQKLNINPTDKECIEWNNKVKRLKTFLVRILKSLKNKGCITDDEYHERYADIGMVLYNKREVYLSKFRERIEIETKGSAYRTDRRWELTFGCDHRDFEKLKDARDLNSQPSRLIQGIFNCKVKEILSNELEVTQDDEKYSIYMSTFKFLRSNSDSTCAYSIHITSGVDPLPDCYKDSSSPESIGLRQSLTNIFKDELCKTLRIKPDKITIICNGWDFCSINIYFSMDIFTLPKAANVKSILSTVLGGLSVREVFQSHGLQKCDIDINFEDDLNKKESLLVGFNIHIYGDVKYDVDEILVNSETKYRSAISQKLSTLSNVASHHEKELPNAQRDQEKLLPPVNVTYQLIDNRIAFVKWESPNESSSTQERYKVQTRMLNHSKWKDVNIDTDETQRRIQLSDLCYDQNYLLRIQVNSDTHACPWSTECHIKTGSLQTPEDLYIRIHEENVSAYWYEDTVIEERQYTLFYRSTSTLVSRSITFGNVIKDEQGYCKSNIMLNIPKEIQYVFNLVIKSPFGESDVSADATSNSEKGNLFEEDGVSAHDIMDEVGEDDIKWAMDHANTIVEKKTYGTSSPEKKKAVLRLLQSLTMMDYTSINKPIKWIDDEGEHTGIYHPMDLLHSIIARMEVPKRQRFYAKLAFSKLSVPVLLNTKEILFCDSSLQHIPITWVGDSKGLKEGNVVNADIPLISMIRMGSLPVSKSIIGNDILGFKIDKLHGSCGFFDRDAESSNNMRKISDGDVEGLWYEKTGNIQDFSQSFALLNLRGDGLHHEQTLKLLVTKSDVVIMFIGSDMFKNKEYQTILESISLEVKSSNVQPKLLVLTNNDEKVKEQVSTQEKRFKDISSNAVFKGIDKNVVHYLHREIECQLKLVNPKMSLMNRFSNNTDMKLESKSIEPSELAESAMHLLLEGMTEIRNASTEKARHDARTKLLPLQAKVKAYADAQRLQNRSSDIKVMQQKNDEAIDIREKQYQFIKQGLPPGIHSFTNFLFQQGADSSSTFWYVQSIQNSLHEWCKQNLTLMMQKYSKACQKYEEKKKALKAAGNVNKSEYTLNALNECNRLTDTIISMSVGIENVLREMGQIYEAVEPHSEDQDLLEVLKEAYFKFPEIAAACLMEGIALEIMDGDAMSSPVKWLGAVFQSCNDRLKKKLNLDRDPRIVVLTVLGTQSTGKSTLLNTMFGIHFPVSAGRCTRGAYMQFIPLQTEDCSIDALVVIDTEGLAAPEFRDDVTHDNELATFVLGLSDLAIINVRGEVPTQIEDFLEISVSALMRMNLVNFQPNCVFVHHNCDPSAHEKNLTSRQCFLQQMDETVKIQADLMKKTDQFQSFKDIMDVSLEQDFFYFPSLLEGSPPMSPPSSQYSQSACRLRDYILEKLMQKHYTQSIQKFSSKLADIWSAVLKENFVLSLRNSAELQVRHQIEKERGNWKLDIVSEVNGDTSRYCNMLQAFANSHQAEEKFSAQFDGKFNTYMQKLSDSAKQKLIDEEDRFHKFIENRDLHQAYFKDWEERTISFMRDYLEKLLRESKLMLVKCHSFNKKEQAWQYRIKLANEKVYDKARNLALQIQKSREDRTENPLFMDEEIECEFEKFWEGIANDLTSENMSGVIYRRENIKELFLSSLLDKFQYKNGFNDIREKFGNLELSFEIEWVKLSYLKVPMLKNAAQMVKNVVHWADDLDESLQTKVAHLFKESVTMQINDYLTCQTANGYSQMRMQSETEEFSCKKLCDQHINHSLDALHQFIKKLGYDFQAGQELEIMFCFHSAHSAIPFFEEAQDSFLRKVDIKKTIQKEREKIRQLFISILKREGELMICSKEITNVVYAKIFDMALEDVKEFNSESSLPKTILQKHVPRKETIHGLVLLDILDIVSRSSITTGDHEKVNCYFKHIIELFTEKIGDVIDCNGINMENELRKKFCDRLGDTIAALKNLSYSKSTSAVSFLSGCEKIKLLGIGIRNFNHIHVPESSDASELIRLMIKVLYDERQFFIEKEINSMSFDDLRKSLITNLKNHLFGCQACCPFCRSMCDLDCSRRNSNDLDDFHMCHTHRPMGFRGYMHDKDRTFDVSLCTQSVASNKLFRGKDTGEKYIAFKEYKTLGPPYSNWKIVEGDDNSLILWKYITFRLMDKIDQFFPRAKRADVSSWSNITLKSAKELVKRKFYVDAAKKVDGVHIT